MSSALVQVLISLTKSTQASPTGEAFANTSVVVTDSSGTPQAPVLLMGNESPTPWAFTTSVAPGSGTVVATDLDVNGATLGSVSQTFTEAGSPPTFPATNAISVTPTASTAAVAAVRAQAKK